MTHTDTPTSEDTAAVASLLSVREAVARRRSVRAFRDAPVDMNLLRDVLATAGRAPSGGNLQPWEAVVLTGAPWAALQQRVLELLPQGDQGTSLEYPIYPPALTDPWDDRRRGVGEALYGAIGIARDDRMGRMRQFADNYRGFGAPVMLFLHCSRIMGLPQWGDMGIWLQSVMLLLVEAGLGSCPQECWAAYGTPVRDATGIPDQNILWTGLAIGHPDWDNPINQWPVPRAPVDEIVRFVGESA